jgi:quinol monooxygenase YgiN
MSKISVIANLTALPGKFDELVALADQMVALAKSEPGTEVFTLSLSADEGAVWFFEVFTDEQALNEHRDSEGMKSFGPTLQRVAEPEFESHLLSFRDAKGVAG